MLPLEWSWQTPSKYCISGGQIRIKTLEGQNLNAGFFPSFASFLKHEPVLTGASASRDKRSHRHRAASRVVRAGKKNVCCPVSMWTLRMLFRWGFFHGLLQRGMLHESRDSIHPCSSRKHGSGRFSISAAVQTQSAPNQAIKQAALCSV